MAAAQAAFWMMIVKKAVEIVQKIHRCVQDLQLRRKSAAVIMNRNTVYKAVFEKNTNVFCGAIRGAGLCLAGHHNFERSKKNGT